MKVFLISAYPYIPRLNCATTYLKESANNDPHKVHEIVDNPKDADIIIFTEHHPPLDPYFFEILRNKTYKTYHKKCYLYHDYDKSLTLIPTISPSIEATGFNPAFHHPYCYIIQIETNKYIKQFNSTPEKKYLFSFIGASRTSPIRKKILSLKYDRSYLLDTSDKNSWELTDDEKDNYYRFYADICFKSKFILCPRGVGPSSYRLYECLEMGIPPVIISDEWLATPGPIWDDFSIRISESDIHKIPQILELRENEADKMGKLAKQAWLDWFAKDQQFHQLTEACLTLHNSRSKINFFTYFSQYLKFFQPYHFRNLLRSYKNKLKYKKQNPLAIDN
jgi:hypothetical protein